MDWIPSGIVGQVVAWVIAAGVLVLILWKGWPTIRKTVGFLVRGVRLVDTLATLPDDLATIKHELQRNSGTSVKDAVIRTEARVAELTDEVSAVRGEVAHVRRQNAALKTTVARTNRQLTDHIGPPAAEQQKTTEPRLERGS